MRQSLIANSAFDTAVLRNKNKPRKRNTLNDEVLLRRVFMFSMEYRRESKKWKQGSGKQVKRGGHQITLSKWVKMDGWKIYGLYLPQMMMMLALMMVAAADSCGGDADVSLPRVSFRCQDRKRWADFSAPAYDIRSENISFFTHRLRCMFSDHWLPLRWPHIVAAIVRFPLSLLCGQLCNRAVDNALLNLTWLYEEFLKNRHLRSSVSTLF